jgi:parvulin-like peptidyl-prolyl isomerase
VDAAAFSLPQGSVSDPIVTDNGAAIVKVLEKQEPAAADMQAQKTSLKSELLNQRKQQFFAAYMNKARQRMNIRVNRDVIAQVTA